MKDSGKTKKVGRCKEEVKEMKGKIWRVRMHSEKRGGIRSIYGFVVIFVELRLRCIIINDSAI